MRRQIQVWREGYRWATAPHGKACIVMQGRFETFEDAVLSWSRRMTEEDRRKYLHKGDDGIWRDCGCRLWDNETDARRAFG